MSSSIIKLKKIKDNIEKSQISDPLTKLEEKMKYRGHKFALKTVTEKLVSKAMRKMRKKKVQGWMDNPKTLYSLVKNSNYTPYSHN